MELNDRIKAMHELAKKINDGRKPEFGDLMRNPWAGEGNPHRDAYFVKSKVTTGRMNPGIWYQMTDRKGNFWDSDAKSLIFIDHLKGDEVFP
ncbi:TPA: hypothetical protein PXN30_002748 [Yersinia enterocolitica]|uniref:hypothetical protein n=1 Tax=Yersinia TaxID=629 RepID=UPI0011AAD477|nr:hypothetical protein [Yersinia mollaretii]EKN3715433.1 hypothetical protein [Yersinia enterocolitica]HDL7377821.1 hypothetical protein [Yersinia enterocolitica]HDL7386717.1 hypothetical protein [Yersinia enterocolitica]HDL7411100.1 hypothetical protein [Yersinia enterocolitica]HDM8088970.1 hypothetical protein [Yersinia enterocolitica]